MLEGENDGRAEDRAGKFQDGEVLVVRAGGFDRGRALALPSCWKSGRMPEGDPMDVRFFLWVRSQSRDPLVAVSAWIPLEECS